jgi:hypothetical protein
MIIDISDLQIGPHPETRNWIIVYEPLDVDLPESAYPYCCYLNHVIFYKGRNDRTVLAETDHQIRYTVRGNTILRHGSQQFVLMTGKVIYHNSRWQCEWIAHKTTGLIEEGGTGFWCQGECVFIEGKYPTQAIDKYRQRLADADIAITSHLPDAIAKRTLQEKLIIVEGLLGLAEEALLDVWDVCSHNHWSKVGKAVSELGKYRSRFSQLTKSEESNIE